MQKSAADPLENRLGQGWPPRQCGVAVVLERLCAAVNPFVSVCAPQLTQNVTRLAVKNRRCAAPRAEFVTVVVINPG